MIPLAVALLLDPCGMVPPIYTGPGIAITRVGPQRTYVFYENGLETYVIRPGFSGKVDEFGMLIPFPSAPALRKVPDEIFAQIAAAIEPPEVVVDLRRYDKDGYDEGESITVTQSKPTVDTTIARDEVRVLKQEAVGMYEVAVLAAGSAVALNKWMEEHGFKYPKGMDSVVDEYVKMSWVFVAEKTKVGSKSASDPKPGMKSVNPSLPSGSTFDGYVQAMGFRFKVDKPIVPMRLSPFNEGEKRQIVYYLTDQPVRIDGVGDGLVVRQLTGERLLKNLTELLPIRIYGGGAEALTKEMLQGLKPERDPKLYNAQARDLFASDLLSLKTGELSLEHEEKEKELLRIGEALSLRGPEIDILHEAELETQRDETAQAALSGLKSMSLTVVDGTFPIAWMKDHDLTISPYRMPGSKNRRLAYDPKNDGPGYDAPGSVRVDDTSKSWYNRIWESP